MKRSFILATVCWSLLQASAAAAGDCRAALRPLLLSAAPEAPRIGEVRALCTREAEAGDADALYQLALMDLGLGGRFEPGVAVPRIRQAAADGVAEAQYWMAWQSEAGPLLPNDRDTAVAWYRRAADGNHRLALDRLATAYEKGELGLGVDEKAALALRARIRQCEEAEAAR